MEQLTDVKNHLDLVTNNFHHFSKITKHFEDVKDTLKETYFNLLAQQTVEQNQWRVGKRFSDGPVFKVSTVELAPDWGPGYIRTTGRVIVPHSDLNIGDKSEHILHADKEFDNITKNWTKLSSREVSKLFKTRR
jgi:hypothetical protein